MALDKHDYAPGETITMQIQAPYTGAGLITIERDHVYSWQWFKTTTTSSVQKIRVPEGLEGNGYVSVSFVRDPSSEEIYASPLSFGVQPFSIALDARRNPITLRAPKLVKPGEDIAIGFRTAQPARLALFAVDEGILQVARYRTPDPLGHFFQKRALDVTTRQILDLILPGFRPSMLSAPGGDQGALLGANLNPFKRKTDKPVAWWAGIVDAGAQERTLHWTVPDYFNGSLRIMAVAVNDSAIGAAEQAALVRGDFVLTPNAPLTVTPGDEFEVSVGVANNIADSGSEAAVAVALQGSPQFEILGPAQASLKIGALREGSARFRARTRDVLGSGTLTFTATHGSSTARLATTVSVRPASTFMTQLTAGSFKGSTRIAVNRTLYPQFRTLEASVSTLPLALAHGLTSYLDHYPYSCTEQLVSQAMPAVVLARRPEFGELKTHGNGSLAGLIDELRARQNGDGSFRYWAGGVDSVDFVSVYALHVLLEARQRGEAVPDDLLESGKAFLLRLARRDGDNLADERTSAYALYLLARQGVIVSNEAAALQQRLVTHYPKQWSSDIVAAYLAATYQLMQQGSLASQTIAGVRFGSSSLIDRWHEPMSDDATLLYLLARHFPARLQRLPDTFLDTLVERVQRGEYQSLSAATTILALDAYATASEHLQAPNLAIQATLADKSSLALPLPAGLFPKVGFAPETRALQFSTDSPLRAYYLVNESGFDRQPTGPVLTKGLEVMREFLDANGKAVQSVKLGDEVTVHLRFRAIGRERIDDAVLVDLLPGGFDLVIPGAAPEDQRLYTSTPEAEGDADGQGEGRGGCLCLWLVTRPPNFPVFADLREDRVVVYGAATSAVQEFSYRIKATNVGSYVVPAAYGESMYDSKVRARSAADHISVIRP
ncbi:MAG: alpha-2-macroglobulin family protein [Steroidobacteraceae bacterium]